MIEKAAGSEADLVFLDLEDSVAPAEKNRARQNAIEGLRELDWGRKLRAVRVNGAHTEWAYADVVAIVEGAREAIDLLILPKVKAPRDVWFFETLLEQLESRLRLNRRIGLEVLIEEAETLARIEDIAGCSPRLEALILGFGDLSASLGARLALMGDYPGDPWHYARMRLVVAARAHGLDAIDGPFGNFRDPEGYRREALRSAALGFVGKWAIHPSQIEIANDVYSPSAAEIETARRMVEAYREAERRGEGAASIGGTLVDAATVRIFEAVLERARLAGRG
jgi:citrate lyase subunit beta/citryl-CoA lyase